MDDIRGGWHFGAGAAVLFNLLMAGMTAMHALHSVPCEAAECQAVHLSSAVLRSRMYQPCSSWPACNEPQHSVLHAAGWGLS